MTSTSNKNIKAKSIRVATVVVAVVMLFVVAFPSKAYAATNTYKRTGNVFPDIIGLGASDVISYTVIDGRINCVVVSQRGGSCLGVINVSPNGYYMKNSNTLVTKWRLTVSLPVKIFNLEKGIKNKTIEYKLGTDGRITSKVKG